MRNVFEILGWKKKKRAPLGNLRIGYRQRKVEIIESFAFSWVLVYVPRTDWYI
jgi:hypothetical protein